MKLTLEENWQLMMDRMPVEDAQKIKALRSAFAFGVCVGSLMASQAVRKSQSPQELNDNLLALTREINLFTADDDQIQ